MAILYEKKHLILDIGICLSVELRSVQSPIRSPPWSGHNPLLALGSVGKLLSCVSTKMDNNQPD